MSRKQGDGAFNLFYTGPSCFILLNLRGVFTGQKLLSILLKAAEEVKTKKNTGDSPLRPRLRRARVDRMVEAGKVE